MTQRRAHIFVRGRVQGVSFRYYTMQEARRLGVEGWVRNLADGRVEAVFEGDAETVQAMVDWCRRGPPAASVDGVDVNWEAPTGKPGGFRVGGY
jgi:acylphosphatase